MRKSKTWSEWQSFAKSAPETEVRAMVLKLVLANAGLQGTIKGLEFISKVNQQAAIRTFCRLKEVCKENAVLMGKAGKKAMAHYK